MVALMEAFYKPKRVGKASSFKKKKKKKNPAINSFILNKARTIGSLLHFSGDLCHIVIRILTLYFFLIEEEGSSRG